MQLYHMALANQIDPGSMRSTSKYQQLLLLSCRYCIYSKSAASKLSCAFIKGNTISMYEANSLIHATTFVKEDKC